MKKAVVLFALLLPILMYKPAQAKGGKIIPNLAGTSWSETWEIKTKSFLGRTYDLFEDSQLVFLTDGETAEFIEEGNAALISGIWRQQKRKVSWTLTLSGEDQIAAFWETLFFETFGTHGTFSLRKFKRAYVIKNRRGVDFLKGKVSYSGVVVSPIGYAKIKVKARSFAFPAE